MTTEQQQPALSDSEIDNLLHLQLSGPVPLQDVDVAAQFTPLFRMGLAEYSHGRRKLALSKAGVIALDLCLALRATKSSLGTAMETAGRLASALTDAEDKADQAMWAAAQLAEDTYPSLEEACRDLWPQDYPRLLERYLPMEPESDHDEAPETDAESDPSDDPEVEPESPEDPEA